MKRTNLITLVFLLTLTTIALAANKTQSDADNAWVAAMSAGLDATAEENEAYFKMGTCNNQNTINAFTANMGLGGADLFRGDAAMSAGEDAYAEEDWCAAYGLYIQGGQHYNRAKTHFLDAQLDAILCPPPGETCSYHK